jgi:hypothetical protein
MVYVIKIDQREKNKKCKVDLCTRLAKSQKKHHGYCQGHFTESQKHLRDCTNFEPTILPPAKKPKRTSKLNGNKNLFVYEESVVHDFLELVATGEVPDHIQAIKVPKTKNQYRFQGVTVAHETLFKFSLGYNGDLWYVGDYQTKIEAGRHYAYVKELLGIGYVGNGWEQVISDLRVSMVKHDIILKFGADVTMSIVELKRLIINSKFTCCFSKKRVLKQKGPYKISIDRIDNSKPHSYENCRVVQL